MATTSIQQATVAAPQAGVPAVAGTPQVAMPTTRRELDMIEMQREALSDQLTSAQGRRRDVQQQLLKATEPADRAGLQQRLTVLDTRIAQLERDIAVTGQQVSSPQAASIQAGSPGPRWTNLSSGQVTAVSIVGLVTIGLPMSMAFARIMWRRARVPATPPGRELTQRLDRMEEGIEAIAVEVERISEGQRFVNKLLGEGAPTPVKVTARVGAGTAAP